MYTEEEIREKLIQDAAYSLNCQIEVALGDTTPTASALNRLPFFYYDWDSMIYANYDEREKIKNLWNFTEEVLLIVAKHFNLNIYYDIYRCKYYFED